MIRLYQWRRGRRLLACWVALVVAGGCLAGEPLIYTELVSIPERGQVKGYVICAKDYRLSLIPPLKWSIKYDAGTGTATLLPPDLEAGISISVVPEPLRETTITLSERLREQVRAQYPDALFTGAFPCFVGGRQGWAVDFERRIENETIRVSFRRAVFEFDEGTVELELKASSVKFSDYHHAYGALLNSLRVTFPLIQSQLVATRTNRGSASGRPGDASDAWSD